MEDARTTSDVRFIVSATAKATGADESGGDVMTKRIQDAIVAALKDLHLEAQNVCVDRQVRSTQDPYESRWTVKAGFNGVLDPD